VEKLLGTKFPYAKRMDSSDLAARCKLCWEFVSPTLGFLADYLNQVMFAGQIALNVAGKLLG
jgi:hypothetical protein